MSLCDDCLKGVRHEGNPEGSFTTIGGVECYVATPKDEYAKNTVILFLPDACGMQLSNSQLLADDFSRNGFKTVLIDYFNGDGVPPSDSDANAPAPGFDLNAWLSRHPPTTVRPYIDKVISELKNAGITTFGATGYCFGGRYVMDLAVENIIQAAAVSHPSLLEIPGTFEKLLATSNSPLLVNSCEFDAQLPIEAQAIVDELLGKGSYAPGYIRTYWEGCTHGFAVRGDLTDPRIKEGKEGAFLATVKFFKEYLRI